MAFPYLSLSLPFSLLSNFLPPILSSQACECLGGNQSALNIKYAVKRQKSLHADDDGESRAVREEVWMERRRRRRMDKERDTKTHKSSHKLDSENI